jgi:cellulose synthase/poly-beta-1,6-N-acetylglucosamine synthase-like glycosyltransferase
MQSPEFGGEALPLRDRGIWNAEPEAAGEQDYGTRLAEVFFPEIAEWRSVLIRLSIPPQTAIDIAVQARADRGDFHSGLLRSGVGRNDLLRAVAADLGLRIASTIDPDMLVISERHLLLLLRGHGGHVPVKLMEKDGGLSFLITPERIRLGLVRARIRACPALAARLKMADPKALRAAVLARARPLLGRIATVGLFEQLPDMSARIVANAWQGTMVGIAVTALPVGLVLAREHVLAVLHGLATFFFFACVALRFAAVASVRPPAPPPRLAAPTGDVPFYSVLVALYREAEMVPRLLCALDRIVWPRERLEIKLVCEADDDATLAAIRSSVLPPHIELIEVPPGGPRTKPKALAYALPMSGGDFIALFDAEDEPHPMQLVEAWQRFSRSGAELAAVQAPLEISNRGDGIIARMFAFEYAALFRGLLPCLSRRRLMLPLGGTSNHFRRAALDEVGGWDPFNVTEDADLGMRLARFGYRAETIRCPTYEPAPKRLGVWLPQRTRWFKGWSQTWLVHMRSPLRLARELGIPSFLVAQVLFAGMLASAILHPLLLVTLVFLVAELLANEPIGGFRSMLLLFDTANIACGYLSFLLLGWQTLTKRERRGFWKIVLFTPVYWVMMSLAGLRAIWHLWRRPHHWDKTPHGISSSRTFHAGRAGRDETQRVIGDPRGPRISLQRRTGPPR